MSSLAGSNTNRLFFLFVLSPESPSLDSGFTAVSLTVSIGSFHCAADDLHHDSPFPPEVWTLPLFRYRGNEYSLQMPRVILKSDLIAILELNTVR